MVDTVMLCIALGCALALGVIIVIASLIFIRAGKKLKVKEAKEIMGNNFLGPKEVVKHLIPWFKKPVFWLTKGLTLKWAWEIIQFIFGVNPWWIGKIPFSKDTLEECKDTHILVAGYPFSLWDIRKKVSRFRKDSWYNNEDFAKKEKVKLRWYLVRKDAVPNSFYKNYAEQLALLDEGNEEVPKACEMAYMVILYYLVTQERLFKYCVRTSSVDSRGGYVRIGFDDDGLRAPYRWDYHWDGGLGLASVLK